MILPQYRIAPSRIAGAGKGLFTDEPVAKGRVIIAPDKIHTLMHERDLRRYAEDSIEVESSVRWFEDWYSLTPEWSDECYVNHSFTPSGLWHLGFVFALDDWPIDQEITMDYRLVIGSGERMPFLDAEGGGAIIGYGWPQALTESTRQLAGLLKPLTPRR